jgi:hypothetical protein
MAIKLRRDVTVSVETDAVDPFTQQPVHENVTLSAGTEVPSAHEDAVRQVDEVNGGGYVIDTGDEPAYLQDAAFADPVRQALLAQVDAMLGDESKVDIRGWSNEQLAQYVNTREFARANPHADVNVDATAELAEAFNAAGNANAPNVEKTSARRRGRGRQSDSGGSDS